ncbi:acetylcholine receptor subunit beta-like [Argonauta hians]
MYRSLNIRVSFCLFIFTILGLLGNIAEGRQIPAYSELSETLESLFHNYDKAVAPQVHYLRPVPVYLKVTVDYMEYYPPNVFYNLLLETRWSDERLSWQPTKQRTLTVSPSLVWQPSFYFENSIDPVKSFGTSIRVDYNGNLVRFQKVSLNTFCPSNSGENDSHFSCQIRIKAHPYTNTEERLTITDFQVNNNLFHRTLNAEVNINDTRINQDPVKLVLDLERKN